MGRLVRAGARLVHPVADAIATNGHPFLLVLSADTFADSDVGDSLRLSAELQDGSPLPTWLSFNPSTRTFSGTPTVSAVYFVRVLATDEDGATAASLFSITVPGGSLVVGYPPPVRVILSLDRDSQTGQVLLSYSRPAGSDGSRFLPLAWIPMDK